MMIDAAGLGTNVIPRIKLFVVDHQFAVKEMHLFNAGMTVRRIVGSRRETYQHADAVLL